MDRLGLTAKVSNNKRSTSRPLALLRKRYSSKFNTSVKIQKFNELVRNKTKSNINTRMNNGLIQSSNGKMVKGNEKST